MNTRILSFGHYVPSRVVTNKDLEKMMETSDEWIQQRSGIKERRWIEPGKDTTLSMATAACNEALKKPTLKLTILMQLFLALFYLITFFRARGVYFNNRLVLQNLFPH